MESSTSQAKTNQAKYFSIFKKGNELGLEFFYRLYYPSIYYYGLRYIKDDVNAHCIVNEAFLRLWLSRKAFNHVSEIKCFVEKLSRQGFKAYFKTANNRFNRNMLRLDELENYQDFMVGYEQSMGEYDPDIIESIEPDEHITQQWKELESLIPYLSSEQQLFIKLCIKYSFDYGRIAWHIGGISDYEVANKVEASIEKLRSIISGTKKINVTAKRQKFRFEGNLDEEQLAILSMRYELQYSFEEIAGALNLKQGYIQKVFASTLLRVKKTQIS